MDRREIYRWLTEEDPGQLEKLWSQADEVRHHHVGDAVHLRGLIEISNHCVRRCGYCGLNVENASLSRYRMTEDEIFQCAQKAVEFGYGTVAAQEGNKLEIDFEQTGRKRVIDSFVRLA